MFVHFSSALDAARASSIREVFFLLDAEARVLWSDASHSPILLPDSRARWEAIWEYRSQIDEIAHSHPIGPEAFSREDETTMRALTAALGRPLLFSVIAPRGMVRREEGHAEPRADIHLRPRGEPWWTALMRLASGMPSPRAFDDDRACELRVLTPKEHDR